MHNQKDIDILIGTTVVRYVHDAKNDEQTLTLHTQFGGKYRVVLDDEGAGGNDSHAFFSKISLDTILNKPITAAWHEGQTRDGVELFIQTKDKAKGTIEVTHQNNGYYGFSYEVVMDRPDMPMAELDF